MVGHAQEEVAGGRDRLVAAALRFKLPCVRIPHRDGDARGHIGVVGQFRAEPRQERKRGTRLAAIFERCGCFERKALFGREPRQRLLQPLDNARRLAADACGAEPVQQRAGMIGANGGGHAEFVRRVGDPAEP
ncbi:MAG TPA: hypothetical protein VJ724_02650, partial [Tahibacter sp.]|nr:hypothetical protein [Tahibacter sp.]